MTAHFFQPRSFYPQANALKPFVSSIHLPNTEHTQELSRCISNVYSLVGVVVEDDALEAHVHAGLQQLHPRHGRAPHPLLQLPGPRHEPGHPKYVEII